MNKTEKIISLLLAAVLAWYLFGNLKSGANKTDEGETFEVSSNVTGEITKVSAPEVAGVSSQDETLRLAEVPTVPEEKIALENELVKLELSSHGAVVTKATLKKYAKGIGEVSDENPALEFDFARSPLGTIEGLKGALRLSAFKVVSSTSNEVVFANDVLVRKLTLLDNYLIKFEETFKGSYSEGLKNTVSLGAVSMGSSKNDILSVDSWAVNTDEVVHHCEGDSPLKGFLVGGAGGCSGSKSAAGLSQMISVSYPGAQKWIALKNRFFVTALVSSSEINNGFDATIARDMKSADYRPESISAKAVFTAVPEKRELIFYVGPKKQSLLWNLDMEDVMEFGMWRWICYPILSLLNFFNSFIPNFGIAIILLTILVRIVFWPLTHKSTIGMKKMQEIQPKMKEIQAKFKDNPQRLQQETWALYREAKVNPMSSCLPMLIQIPVFIALFNVLRSAVELRYAPFLWIADLSEPEALFSSWFPFGGGLNILPIFMALTMALQSALTPSTGDKNQQRMMVVFMPIMMLVMFYNFPSALSLYWTLSQIFSIVQMWLIRRHSSVKTEVVSNVEVIDPPVPRQMKRHR